MSISHRTNRLKLVGTPAVEQLQNGRYQLTINCTTINRRTDWYSANKARIFPDFGSLQSAQGSIDGLGARTGEAYTDMRLVSLQSSTQGEQYIVTLVYATLGSEFVQVKDDTISHTESGLRRVTRTSIAQAGTDFQKTVGTSSIDSQIDNESAIECKLASYEIDDTDSFREVTEVYVQPGIISSVEDFEGSQKSFVQETFSQVPDTPTGFSRAREEISNVDGIPTTRHTFLKNETVLSESEDKVGSQLAIVKEVFNGTPATPSGYSLADSQTSNVDGIPTKRFRFLKDNVTLSESEDKVGSQLAIVKEVFNGTPTTPAGGYSLADSQISDFDGIPTRRFRFLKNNVVLSKSEDKVGSQLAIVKQVFNGTPDTPGGYAVADEEESNVDGIPTKRFRFLKSSVTLSESEDKIGSQLAIVKEVFNGEPSTPTGGYILADSQTSNVDGIPTKRFRFLKSGVELSRSDDLVGSQRAITTEVFNPDNEPDPPTGYELASTQESSVDGVPTKSFTFLKTNIKLSESEDRVGSQLAIVQEWFKPDTEPSVSDYVIANVEESNLGDFPTERYTFLKSNVNLSSSEDKVGSQKAITEQWFKPDEGRKNKSDYSLAREEASDVDGIPTERYTFLKDNVELSRQTDKLGSLETIVTEVFNPASDVTESNFTEVNRSVSDFEGIKTERYTFYKNNAIISESFDAVGSQKAVVIRKFQEEPTVAEAAGFAGSGTYLIAKKEQEGKEGVEIYNYTFLKNNATLSESEDEVGSQKAIVREIFGNDIAAPTDAGYEIARTEISSVDGIPTKRFTLLKTDIELSRSLDKVGSQEALVVEFFKRSSASEPTQDGYQLAKSEKSNVGGFPTERFTFLKPDVTLSTSEDKLGSLEVFIQEVFAPATEPSKANFTEVKREESEVDGVKTQRVTFYRDDAIISQSTDRVGSQQSVVIEKFKSEPTVSEATSFGDGADYTIAREEVEGKEGLEIYRYTFLEKNSELSRRTDKLGALETIVTEVFNPDSDVTESEYTEVSREVSDFEGIPTERYTFYKDNAIISQSRDLVGSQQSVVIEKFKEKPTAAEAATFGSGSDYEIAREEQEGKEGSEIYKYTFLEKGVILSKREDKLGSLETIVIEAFNLEEITEPNFTEVSREASDFEGIKTERVTLYKDDAIISQSTDLVGSQKSVVIRKFKAEPTTSEADTFGGGDNYAIARKEEEGKENAKIYNYTFLQSNSELSKSEDFVGSQKAIVKEIFNPDEDPEINDYSLARTEQSAVDGISTKRFTFLKDGAVISRSEDKVGSQKAIVTEIFNPEKDPTEDDYSIAKTEKSDVDGIPTTRFTFLKDNVELSKSEDNVGSQKAIVKEIFNPDDDPEVDDYSIARKEESNVVGVPTKRFTFLKDNVKLSESEDKVGSQLAITQEWYNPEDEPEVNDYVIANVQKSDVAGIPTERYTFLKANVKLSESEDKVGSQLAIVQELFKPEDEPEINDYIIANVQKSDVEGIPTERYTFLKENVKLSESQDKVGSQLAIVQEWFALPDGEDAELPTNDAGSEVYTIAKVESSNVSGIPTKRYTFLLKNLLLSETEDKVGSQLAIVQEWFGIEETEDVEIPDSTVGADYIIAKEEKSNINGIPTERYTFLLSNIKLSESEDKIGSQKALIQDWFGIPDGEDVTIPEAVDGSNYIIANVAKSDVGGITTERYTFLLENVQLSETTDKVGSQLSIVQEWFALPDGTDPEAPTPESSSTGTYVIANVQESDFNGIPTKRYTFLLKGIKLSENEDKVGDQLAIVQEWFGIDEEPTPPEAPTDGSYVIAKVDKSNVEGIPTERYTFLVKGIKLNETEDKIGSQLAIVQDWFGLDDDPSPPESSSAEGTYMIANVERSDVGGIPTERYTFLLKSIQLSESEDKVGSQLATVQEWFGKDDDPQGPGDDYIIANVQTSNLKGVPTKRYTFLKTNIKLSESEDRVGSQLTKVQEWFNPDNDPDEDEYIVAKTEESNIGGIPTKKFTLLKEKTELSRSEDKVGSQLAIVTEVFKPENEPDEGDDHVLAKEEVSNVDGIPTKRFTFLKNNSIISRTVDDRKGTDAFALKREIIQVFNPEGDPDPTESKSILISKETRDEEGIKTEVFTFVHGEGVISDTESSADPALPSAVKERTIVTLGDPENFSGGEPQDTNVLISKKKEQQDGYELHTRVYLSGEIEGTTTEYEDYVDVEMPGEVDLVQESVSSGGVSGTIAIAKVQPKRILRKKAKIKIEIVKDEVDPAESPAFDLGKISCAVTSTNLQLSVGPGSTVTIGAGTNNVMSDTGFVQDFKVQTSVTHYPGHFLKTAQAEGEISYVSSSQPVASGNIITREESEVTRKTKLIGTGSLNKEGFEETGEISRRVRPILVDHEGTTYYEVRTVKVS